MYFEFVSQYWYLFAALVVIVLLLSINPAMLGGSTAPKISAIQLPQLQTRQNAVILDVGSAQEFARGHIEQAINLPVETLKDNLNKLNKFKSRPIILSCQSGAKSAKAASVLRAAGGFPDLHILEGGLTAWRKENLPLV